MQNGNVKIRRTARRDQTMMVPRYADELGYVIVDSTWGQLQPLKVAPGIDTVGELDVIAHVEAGLPLVDTRHDEQHRQATIPGARCIPHEEIVERIDELDCERVTVLFCNGPQCKATPDAARLLLAHGYPAHMLRYYRGGIHDWMTLGLPIEGSRRSAD
jgi:rhodanese-related sulfurtransferase